MTRPSAPPPSPPATAVVVSTGAAGASRNAAAITATRPSTSAIVSSVCACAPTFTPTQLAPLTAITTSAA